MLGDFAKSSATRIVIDDRFGRAAVFFGDGSYLRLEHSSRQNRWACSSSVDTTADSVCQALDQFRLNARHLQLFFDDGSDADFPITQRGGPADGTTVG